MLPETGLWADGFTELGYGRDPGLVIFWGLDPQTVARTGNREPFDWSLVSYRTRVEVFNSKGKSVSSEERIVDPPKIEDGLLTGGFPAAVHVLLRKAGDYRVRLEAYPLIEPSAAGLDTLPHRTVEATAHLTHVAPEQSSWQISDLFVVHDMSAWTPGTPRDRTWYEWSLDPAVSRAVTADSNGSYLAFEVQRGRELVPQCQATNCRVVVSVTDEAGGLALQTLRPVPAAFSVSAYVVPIETVALGPGDYVASVEVFEGGESRARERRAFRVRRRVETAAERPGGEDEASPMDSP